MAGERKGKTYEALVMVALQRLKREGSLDRQVFWNKLAAGMTVEPDFTVGKDVDHPHAVFLITHSGAAGNSHMKFWRNMGELAEAKIFVPSLPKVYSIAFDPVIKEDLKKLQAAAFDGQLIVGDREYGRRLQLWVDGNSPRLPRDADDKVGAILDATVTGGGIDNPKELIDALTSDIKLLLRSARPELDRLWAIERGRTSGQVPPIKETFVRRGLSKLLIFEDSELAIRLYRGRRVRMDNVPQYAFELGLARKAITGAVPGDSEARNAVSLLGEDQVRSVLASAPRSKISGWLLTLRNAPHLQYMGQYVATEYGSLCEANELTRRMQRLHDDVWALVDGHSVPENWPPPTVWLMEYLIELIKASTGNASGYGYAQLAREVEDPDGPAGDFDEDTRRFLLSPWGHLSEWIHRDPKGTLPPKVLAAVSTVLALRISGIGEAKGVKLAEKLPGSIVRNIVESKLCTYSGFDPLLTLISDALPSAQVIRLRTAFADRAGLSGQAGKTQVAQVGSTLINWQSVSDAGRGHKKKELCGRAMALRYSWNHKIEEFVPRPGISKLALLVDGTWRQSDLDALARAGWDEIFYPDEMERLVEAVK